MEEGRQETKVDDMRETEAGTEEWVSQRTKE
jgi:hypothetical protein